MICLWRINYFAFVHSLSSHKLMHQLEIDVPRSTVVVNGTTVGNVNHLESLLTGALHKCILPFLTQASMALLFTKLTRTFSDRYVMDGGSTMLFDVKTSENCFEIDIHKKLKITSTNLVTMHFLMCTIHISSDQDNVLLSCESGPHTDDWGLL